MSSRNNYPAKFKLEAVSLVKDQGYTYADAGRALSTNPSLNSRCCKEHDTGKSVFQGYRRLTPDQERIRELEKQVR